MSESFVKVNGLSLYETEDGITSLTTMVTVVVELPPLLVAVTVKVAEEVIAVGVPLITPVEESIANPAGSVEETDQEILSYALMDFRNRFDSQAKEVITPFDPDINIPDVTITIPKRGDKKHLL